ncbi:NCS1 nucleoside transporter family [Fistulina hepatica ATCC 64428]|uniref:NCS1 nucleoside transporter family n=1 Tax=Fistulina hepatica ATCC 64428 TaxID=1128425 RepID=A0A0D7A5D3_9AGAR|nr:NCS1 nucleoside transporter family [Fistulina hepatica ATCC 64428]
MSFHKPSSWALEPSESTFAPSSRWSNKDMDPVPEESRTWRTRDFIAYWISDAANVATWELASSMIAVGLSWKQALPAIAIGHLIISVVVVLNGTIGARLHISFSVLNRSSFGFWFSYFTVISRAVLAMFWFGIQTYTGSQCVYQMLKAIWPSTARIPNHLSGSANITTSGIMCYFLYWLIQLPFLFVSPMKIRYLFTAKSIIVPAAWMAIFIWSLVKVPTNVSLAPKHASVSGSALSWAFLNSLNSALGNYATLSVNIPDFTRYAKHPRSQYIQLIIIPVLFTFAGFIGIAVTYAGEVLYGSVIWDPLDMIDLWDNRAAAFFAAFSFSLATLGTNISANSLSAANDLTALWPRYINIRRGQIICATIGGWALCPWDILASAPGFLTFMGGYTVFLGPFAAIMITDYYLIHKCKVDVPAMYDPHGRYKYWNGINWRALVAMLCATPVTLPGLAATINTSISVGKVSHLYDIGWLYGFFCAAIIYGILSYAFPAKETFLATAITGDYVPSAEDRSDDASTEKKQVQTDVIACA